MYRDIAEIRQFYQSRLGALTQQTLQQELNTLWQDDATDVTVVGVGYALPYLDAHKTHFAAMPAALGATRWPQQGLNHVVVTEDHVLPFATASVDRLVLVHALENADYLREIMAESWRVLKPNGFLVAIVPNRTGLWAYADKTPFGHGRPYTMKQMRRLLQQTDFVIESHCRSLYFLPSRNRVLQMLAPFLAKTLRMLLPKCGGVLLVQASKQLYNVTAIPVQQRARVTGFRPAPPSCAT